MKKAFGLRVFPLIIYAFGYFCLSALFFGLLVNDSDLSTILYSYEMTDEIFFGFVITIFYFGLIGFVCMVCKVIRQFVFIVRDSHVSPSEEVSK